MLQTYFQNCFVFCICLSCHINRCIALLVLGRSSLPEDDSTINQNVPEEENIYADLDDEDERPPWSNPFALSLLADLYLQEGTIHGNTEAARCFALLRRYDSLRAKTWARKESAAKLSVVMEATRADAAASAV